MNFDYLKYQKPCRERYKAQGLTARGKPRINKLHPALAGLHGRDYHRLFMREWRREL